MKQVIKKMIAYDKIYPALRKSPLYVGRKKINAKRAANIAGNPAKNFFIIGVTGTNGKTTTVNILHHILQQTVANTVMVSTATIKIADKTLDNTKKMSSLDAFDLQGILTLAREQACKIAVLEVTSIGLEQFRFESISFDAAVLTNITEDHLDYHGTMENYANAKKKLFTSVLRNRKSTKFAVFPKDDPYGRQRAEDMPFDKKITYSLYSSSNIKADNIQESKTGTTCTINYLGQNYILSTSLVGAYNLYNILAALSVVVQMGVDLQQAIDAVASFTGVPGRMETIEHKGIQYSIDFAHSPDALEKTLSYLTHIKDQGRLIVVFGAPGNRDKGKRPNMGAIVDRFADIIIATDDDPDTENRLSILDQLTHTIQRPVGESFVILPDRATAIYYATQIAHPGDIVMIAGK